jgi:hypothetical protein
MESSLRRLPAVVLRRTLAFVPAFALAACGDDGSYRLLNATTLILPTGGFQPI